MKLQGAVLVFALLAECGAANDIGSELIQAAKNGDQKTVRCLLETKNRRLIEKLLRGIGAALYQAALKGSLGVVECLLEAGTRDGRFMEALSGGIGDALVGAALKGNLDVAECLMERGTNNGQLAEGLSARIGDALWIAVLQGDLEMVKCLLEMKSDRLTEGMSDRIGDALWIAVLNGGLEMVECLIEAIINNRRLMGGLSGIVGKLGGFIASSGDNRMIELLPRLPNMEVATRIPCYIASDSSDEDECPICFQGPAGSISTLKCRHLFHESCIEDLVGHGSECGLRCATCGGSMDDLLEREVRFSICRETDRPAELFVFCSGCGSEEDADRALATPN